MEDLLARGFQASGQAADQCLVLAPEAERMVEALRQHGIAEVGTPNWMEQQGAVHKLNVQSHYNAHAHADEFVKDYLVSFDKVRVLVHELLLMEVWKAHLLPHLKKHLAKKVDSITSYLLISHEADLANLLEVTLYHEQALDNIEEDFLMELVDWCSRQLQYLNSHAAADAAHVEHTAKARSPTVTFTSQRMGRPASHALNHTFMQEMLARSEVDEFDDKLKASRLAVATCSVTIIRYLTDAASRLSVSLLTRLLLKHDIMMALVPLAENPPWQRQRADGTQERLEGSQWVKIEASERFHLSNTDAQVRPLSLPHPLAAPPRRAPPTRCGAVRVTVHLPTNSAGVAGAQQPHRGPQLPRQVRSRRHAQGRAVPPQALHERPPPRPASCAARPAARPRRARPQLPAQPRGLCLERARH